MKKNDTKKIIFSNNKLNKKLSNKKSLNDLMIESKIEVLLDESENINESSVADALDAGLKNLGKDYINLLNVFKTAGVKLFKLYVSYPKDLFVALVKGESLRAVNLKHSEIQRNLTKEMNTLVNGMSGAKDLNNFIALAAPHVKVMDFVMEKGGGLEKKVEDLSTSGRKNFNKGVTYLYKKNGANPPSWLLMDTGDEYVQQYQNRTSFHDDILDITELFVDDIGIKKFQYISDKKKKKINIEKELNVGYKKFQDVFKSIINDEDKKKIINAYIEDGLLLYTDDRTSEKVNVGIKDKEIKRLASLLFSQKVNLKDIYTELYKNSDESNSLSYPSELKKLLNTLKTYASIKRNQKITIDNEELDFNLFRETKKKKDPKDEKEADTPDEPSSDTPDEKESESNESYSKKIKFINGKLLKEEENITEESEDDIYEYIVGEVAAVINAICFIDVYVLIKLLETRLMASSYYIKGFQELSNKVLDMINKEKIDPNDFKFEGSNISKNKSVIIEKITNIESLIESISYEEIEEMFPQFSGAKKEFLDLANEEKKYANSINDAITKAFGVFEKNSQDLLSAEKKDDAPEVPEDAEEKLKISNLVTPFLEELANIDGSILKQEAQENISTLENVGLQGMIENYEVTLKEAYDDLNLSIINNSISANKISDVKSIIESLKEYASSETTDFTQKIKEISDLLAEKLDITVEETSEDESNDESTENQENNA